MAELTPKTINELPSASSISDSDLFAVSSSGASKKTLWSTIKDAIWAGASSTNSISNSDLFLLNSSGTAKKVQWQTIHTKINENQSFTASSGYIVKENVGYVFGNFRYFHFCMRKDDAFGSGYLNVATLGSANTPSEDLHLIALHRGTDDASFLGVAEVKITTNGSVYIRTKDNTSLYSEVEFIVVYKH